MKENLVFDFKRIFSGLILISLLTTAYYFNLDNFIYVLLIFFSIYDLFYSKFLKINESIIYLIIFVLIIIAHSFTFNYFQYLFLIQFIFILLMLFHKKKLNHYFFLSILIFLIMFIHIGKIDRNLFYQIFLIAFLNDSMAYLFGKFIKGPKIIPSISPNKTWSGTILSFFITFGTLSVFGYNLFIAFLLSASLFFGDIFFSYIKRKMKIKDFSNLINGHGGLLDRLDSMYLFVIFFQLTILFN